MKKKYYIILIVLLLIIIFFLPVKHSNHAFFPGGIPKICIGIDLKEKEINNYIHRKCYGHLIYPTNGIKGLFEGFTLKFNGGEKQSRF